MEPDLGAAADESGQGSVVVGDGDRNVHTMEWPLNTPEIENPADESDSSSHCFAEVPGMPESDPSEADPLPEPAPASVVYHTDSVSAVSTPDFAIYCNNF